MTKQGALPPIRVLRDVCCRGLRKVRRLWANLVRAAQTDEQPGPGMSEHEEGTELSERVDALAAWIKELDGQLRASTAVGDPKALKELAKALEAWNKHDPKLEQRLTNRVDVLADRLTTLAGTVNVTATSLAGKDGEIAGLRRELEEGNARIESVVHGLQQTGPGSDVAELRRAVEKLASERRSLASDSRVDIVSGEMDVLAQRLEALSETVTAATAGLAGREGELIALRVKLEETDERAGALAHELQESVDALASQVAVLEDRSSDADALERYENYLGQLAGQVEHLAGSLDAVSASVASATESISANEIELEAVNRRFEAASAHVDGLIGDLQQTVSALPAAGAIDPEVEDRLHALGAQVEGATRQLAELETAMTAQWREGATSAAAIEHELADVSQRLANVEHGRDEAIAALDRASETWVEERAWVRDQLEQLAAAVEDARADETLAPRLSELAARVEAMELGQESVSAAVARAAEAWDAQRDELKGELEALSTTMSSLPAQAPAQSASKDDDTVELLTELAERLDSLEREKLMVATEISQAQEHWASAIGAIEARLDDVAGATPGVTHVPDTETVERIGELARRLEAVEHEREATPDAPAVAEELRDLRVLMNGLRMRLTSNEKELDALSSRGDVVSRLDDIALRLASLERSAATYAAVPAPVVPGDGRFRVEMRGLDQRMEQLESAARENRDAVLAQFERLASRLQWRLQQLELESTDAGYSTKATPTSRGQVVPIRSEG